MADPVDAVEQHFAHGILEAPVAIFGDVANHGQGVAVGGPVCVLHIIEHFAWRTSAERNASESSRASVAAVTDSIQPDGKLTALRNRKQFGIFDAKLASAGIVGSRQIELRVTAIPGSAVDDATVRREAGVADRAGA